MKKSKKFTLIELLVVISIIVALAALLMPALGSVKEGSLKNKVKAKMSAIKIALEAFYTEYNKYPQAEAIKELYGHADDLAINTKNIKFYSGNFKDDWSDTETLSVWVDTDYDEKADKLIIGEGKIDGVDASMKSGVPIYIHSDIGGSKDEAIKYPEGDK